MSKSFYMLEFFVWPGSSRKAEYYVFNDLEDIKEALQNDLTDGLGLYLLFWYGEMINITVYHDGKEVQKVGMHPAIRVHLPDYPTLGFDEDENILGLGLDPIRKRGGEESGEDELMERETEVLDKLSDYLWELQPQDIQVEIDWERAGLLPLQGSLLQSGESICVCTASAEYTTGKRGTKTELVYGYNLVE
jgi:hypothetical protein